MGHHAAHGGHAEVVEILSSHSAAVSIRDDSDLTPFGCACLEGRALIAMRLFECAGQMCVADVNVNGFLPLVAAVAFGGYYAEGLPDNDGSNLAEAAESVFFRLLQIEGIFLD